MTDESRSCVDYAKPLFHVCQAGKRKTQRGGSLEGAIQQWICQYGYLGIFFLLMLGIIGLPIPDEVLMTFAGYLVFKGQLALAPTIASAFLGSICGVSVSYSIGRTGGSFLVRKYGRWFHVTPEKIGRVHEWLEHAGKWGLLIGYFIPGVRHLSALVAGTSRLGYPLFAAYAYTGGLFWSSTFILAGFFLGKEWIKISASIHRWMLIAVTVGACLLLVYYLLQRKVRKDN
jgi:membrane protein DedA with SNARE-associated domain